MAVPLPQAPGGSLVPEYAANNITFNRTVQCINGVVEAVFTAHILYALTTYVVDATGKKIAIVAPETTQPMQPRPDLSNTVGDIYVNAEQLATIIAQSAVAGMSAFDAISNLADELIKADLITRKIITA